MNQIRHVNASSIQDNVQKKWKMLVVFHTWNLTTKLDKVKRKLSKLIREDNSSTRKHRLSELDYAWQARDLAHTWKLGKIIAGKPLRTIAPRGRMNEEEWA